MRAHPLAGMTSAKYCPCWQQALAEMEGVDQHLLHQLDASPAGLKVAAAADIAAERDRS